MIIWCMLIVRLSYGGTVYQSETAVKGKLISEYNSLYLIDFSEYAQEKGYLGKWSEPLEVNQGKCVKGE